MQVAGHEVRIATAPSFAPAVTALGLVAVPCGRDWLESRIEDAFPGFLTRSPIEQIQVFAAEAAPVMAADIVTLATEWRPDLLVRDCTEWGGWVAAEELGVPSIVYGVIAPISSHTLNVLRPQFVALRAERGPPPDPDLATMNGVLYLDPTPPSLDRASARPVEVSSVRVRPVYADVRASDALPAWLGQDNYRPVVFATLGTVFHNDAVLVRKIIAAVADEPYRVLLALGAGSTPPMTIPTNVHLERYVPLSLALPACSAVLCHAGRGTVLTALACGVPLCMLPLAADHPPTADMVERAGAGLCCATGVEQRGSLHLPHTTPAQLDPLALRQQLHRVLHEHTFVDRARTLQAEIGALPGPGLVTRLLEGVLAKPRTARASQRLSGPDGALVSDPLGERV
jgi:UDP:flavonoid glycosyltransferase YjiC (YdhE family)